VFVGLKQTDALAAQDARLENALSLGFFSAFAWPLLWSLKAVNTVVGSWGWSILVLTLLVKIVFWPLQIRSFRSAAEMQAIQPELTAIREKLKDKPEELNRATAALFSERGVSPLGGCLPMLVQLPVWIALFAALTSSVELYQAQWFWLRDLSAPDPTLVLPILMMVGMLLQQRMTPTTGLDPAQANMMKAMPILFGFLYLNLPSGLALYSIANLGISVLQHWMFKRTQAVVSPPAASPSA
jgi:YidC/Oxa1 family membrane protein insertase